MVMIWRLLSIRGFTVVNRVKDYSTGFSKVAVRAIHHVTEM